MNRLRLSLVLLSGALAAVAPTACGSSSGTSAGGSGGAAGAAGSGGQAPGSGGSGSGGAAPVDAAGSGGSAADVASAEASADADAGAPEVTPSDVAGDAPPIGRFACPAGGLAAPRAGDARTVCAGIVRYNWNEGPTWVPGQNAFFFSNFPIGTYQTGDMLKYTPSTGQCEIYIEGARCNGMTASNDGNILATCQGNRSVMKYDLRTKQGTVVASMVNGQMFDTPNDIVQHSNGTIYFTNPTFELGGRPVGLGSAVLRIDPAGAISVIARGGVNGVALSPDEKRLYVVNQGVWDLDAQGVPSNMRAFALGADGIAVDCAGNIYDNGGNITSPAGQRVGTFPPGTNMAFGGPDGKTLLVVGNQSARTVEMNVPGPP